MQTIERQFIGITLDNLDIRDIVDAELAPIRGYTDMNTYTLIIALLIISELLVLIRDDKRVPAAVV